MFRRQAYYNASAVFILLACLYFFATANQAYVGLKIANIRGQWIVISSDPQGEGYKLGIRIGDVILKIDNSDPGNYRYVQRWSETEGASNFEIRKQDEIFNQMINIPVPLIMQNTLSEIPFVILGFVFLSLGFITFLRRPYLAEARTLFWFNWCTGLAIALASASSRDLLFARELEYIIFAAIPIFLVNFVSSFLNENNKQINRWGRHIFILMFVIIVIITVLQSTNIISCFSSLRKLVLVTMSVGSLFALWNLVALLTLPKDKPQKNQVNIILLGMVMGLLPFLLLTAVPIIFGFQPIMNAHYSSLFVSVIPTTCYYAVVNKYLPDSRKFLGTIVPFSIAGIIVSFVVTYLNFILKLSEKFSLEMYLRTLALFVVLVLCFSFIRTLISKILEKFLFSEKRQTFKKRIFELNERLSMLSEENLILKEVTQTFSIEGVFIIAKDSKGKYFKISEGRFVEKFSEQSMMEELFQADRKTNLNARILPDNFPAGLYIPVTNKDYRFGIFLGHRHSYVKFEPDELPAIALISSQLAQCLITMLTFKELSKEIVNLTQKFHELQRRTNGLQGINMSLFRSLERERKIIASDIHDGPLQLGLDLNRWLKCLVEKCVNNDKAVNDISHMRELVENLNFELRLICNDLRPPSLTDLGLVPAIELLCEEIMQKELLLISLETKGMNRGEHFEEETELAAYRFVQEGITNAVKHSSSKELKIQIEKNESQMELRVSDSGKGFDTSKIDDWVLTSVHFGLVGMKERLESLNGNLQVNSIIGKGTILKATIPIKGD
ncbi:ATP-binding protein [Desulfosporosinus sp. PR]|nr:ATP-binding protein [Desulfosporosinus sp. PR]